MSQELYAACHDCEHFDDCLDFSGIVCEKYQPLDEVELYEDSDEEEDDDYDEYEMEFNDYDD